MTKFCGKCGVYKLKKEFGIDKNTSDGRRYECKTCRSRHEKSVYFRSKDKHKARVGKYKDRNREKVLDGGRKYYYTHLKQAKRYGKEHSKEKLEWARQYRETHKDLVREYMKGYNKKNRKELSRKSREYQKRKRRTDVVFKIKGNLRSRMYNAIRGGYKSARTEGLIGCSVKDLMMYLEKKFLLGMSWDNYGKWHIDHIIPCCSFDLFRAEEQKRCFNFINLQPLWAEDNLRKNKRIAI